MRAKPVTTWVSEGCRSRYRMFCRTLRVVSIHTRCMSPVAGQRRGSAPRDKSDVILGMCRIFRTWQFRHRQRMTGFKPRLFGSEKGWLLPPLFLFLISYYLPSCQSAVVNSMHACRLSLTSSETEIRLRFPPGNLVTSSSANRRFA